MGQVYNTEENKYILEQNKEVKRWGNMVTSRLQRSAARFADGKSESMVIRGKLPGNRKFTEFKLAESIGHNTYYSYGMAEGIGFKIQRHGVFVEKGVGSGYIMSGGMVMRGYKKAETAAKVAKRKNNKKQSFFGTRTLSTRKPRPWFNPVVEGAFPELERRITEINKDAIIDSMNIKIK